MKVFDLNVVRRLKLPTEAIQLIIQYLQEAHPTARFIKSVNFKRFPTVLRVCGAHMRMHRRVAVWNHPPLLYGLCVRHVRLRKDPDDDEAFASFRFNPKTGARERHAWWSFHWRLHFSEVAVGRCHMASHSNSLAYGT